jgi:hypothetical protein
MSQGISINNITWDQPGNDNGWFIYIAGDDSSVDDALAIQLNNLRTYGISPFTYNGFYIDDYSKQWSNFNGLIYDGVNTEYGGGFSPSKSKIEIIGPILALDNASSGGWTSIDLSSIVPASARECWGIMRTEAGGGVGMYLSPRSDGVGAVGFLHQDAVAVIMEVPFRLPLETSSTLWYQGGPGASLFISGYSYP